MGEDTRDTGHGQLDTESLLCQARERVAVLEARLAAERAGRRSATDVDEVSRRQRGLVALVENAFDFVGLAALDGRVEYLNRTGRRLVGLPESQDLSSMSLLDFAVAAEQPQVATETLRAVFERGEARGRAELRHFRGGPPVPIEFHVFLLREPGGGQPSQIAVVMRDLRPQLEAEAERASLEEQLRLSSKLEAIGRLAGGVAHDFNNLLTGITGYTQLILEELGDDDPVRADIQEIDRAAERASELTGQLLAFSRRQVIQPRVMVLDEVLRQSERMLGRVLGEDVALRFDLSDAPWPVRADPSQMEQVLVNLAVNARDAMPDGGSLEVTTANTVVDEPTARLQPPMLAGEYVRLSVSDTGEGMDSETLSQVFEPFFSTKERGKGTGLGLSTVYGIMKQNRGFIWVDSALGEGTTFQLYLPREPDAKAPTPAEFPTLTPPPAPPPKGNEILLLAEDEGVVRRLTKRTLEAAGYRVVAAASGEEALERFERDPEAFDLLLSDVVMPGIHGNELYEAIARRRPELPVVYMSGYAEEAIAHKGVLDEDHPFLSKPFTIAALLETVRQALDG